MRALAGDVQELERTATANGSVKRLLVQIAVVGAVLCVATRAAAQTPFHLQEATIGNVHSAFASGQLTCTQLTRLYLDRIEAYNLKGPTLRAIITVNPKALETAAEMDRQYQANPRGRRAAALHPDHPQGQLQHRRHADDGRQCRHEGLGAARRCVHRREACARRAR